MRYKPNQKEETRKKMLAAVGRGFRSNGYAGIGVDGLAKAAGVTSGAFYAHFGSKGGAFDSALDAGLDEVIEAVPIYQRENGKDWVKAFVDYYLGVTHQDDLEGGCAMTTLTPEVVRSDSKVHEAFEQKMTVIIDLVAKGLAGDSEEDRRSRGWAMLSMLIGGLNFSRGMNSNKLSEEIAEAIKTAAIQAAGQTLSVS